MKQVVVRKAKPNDAFYVAQAMESVGCEIFAIVPPLGNSENLTIWGKYLWVDDASSELMLERINDAIFKALSPESA